MSALRKVIPSRLWGVDSLRLVIAITCLLIGVSLVMLLAPTGGDGAGLATSIAYQRTDVAIGLLVLVWLSAGLAAVGFSLMAGGFALAGLALAAVGVSATSGNPMVGAAGAVMLLAPPIGALAFAAARKFLFAEPVAEPDAELVDAPAEDAPEPAPKAEILPPAATTGPLNPIGMMDPDAAERLAFMRIRADEAGSTEAALALWAEIIEEQPDYFPALNGQARVLSDMGRLEEARACLTRSLAIAPDEIKTLRLAARLASNDEDWSAAADYWRHAFSVAELSADAAAAYVSALVRADRLDEAEEAFRASHARWPSEHRLAAAGALAAETRGDDPAAFERWRTAAELEPAAFSHRRRTIRALLRLDRLPEAARMAKAYDMDAVEAADKRAAVSVANLVKNEAVKQGGASAPEVLAILAPKDAVAWATLVERRLSENELEAAEAAYQAAVAGGAASAGLFRAGARVAMRAERKDMEAERWPAVAELEPKDLVANRRAASVLSTVGEAAAAKVYVERGLALEPKDEALMQMRASLAICLQDWEEALEAWKAYGRAHGLNASVAVGCATALCGLERLEEAETLVEASLTEYGDDLWLLAEYARLAEGDGEKAEARWRRVIEVDRTSDVGWRGLVRVLVQAGDEARARGVVADAQAAVESKDRFLRSPFVQSVLEAESA